MKNGILQKTYLIGKLNLRFSDVFFAVVLIAVAVYFFLTAPYGITVSDESQYQYVNWRLMTGNKLFADNWMLVGMQTMFQYLPFRVYCAVTGGVEGIVLAMRWLYVGVKLILAVYLYIRLRKYGFWAIFAAVFFVGTDLFGIKTLSYYSICPHTVLLTGILLFFKKDPKPVRLVFAGFIFSCCVLVIPVMAAIWFVYCLLTLTVFLAEKKGKRFLEEYAFVLTPRVWLYTFAGIAAAAAVFFVLCACFFTGTSVGDIVTGVREIFGFVNAGSTAEGVSFAAIRLSKLFTYIRLIHWSLFALTAAVFVFGVVLHRLTARFERLSFLLLCTLCAAVSVRLLLLPDRMLPDAAGECVCHPLTLTVPAIAAYMFTKEKNRRLFAFLALSISVSAVMDVYSNSSFGSMLLADCVPAVLLIRDYVLEQRAAVVAPPEKKKVKKKNAGRYAKAWSAALCALLIVFPALEVWHYAYMARFHETERLFVRSDAPLDAKIENGVLKGINTVPEIRENYEKAMRDAAYCASICKNTLLVIDYDTVFYLTAGVPVSTPVLHISGEDWSIEERWWSLHPEKRPDVVYIPDSTLSYIDYVAPSTESCVQYFAERAEIEVEPGEFGTVVKIARWR